jgi:hypothetical protein
MIKTFKRILEDIETFCDNHNQINSFSWGNPNNISTKNHTFPMVWLQPTTSTINGHMMTLSFDMYIMDLVKQDLTNLKDVMNDTLLMGNDVVSKFWSDCETYDWVLNEDGVSMEPFDAKFDDYTGGWIFRINIEIENRLSNCNIPENLTTTLTTNVIIYTTYNSVALPLTTFTLYESDKVTEVVNGITGAGGTYNIPASIQLGDYWIICSKTDGGDTYYKAEAITISTTPLQTVTIALTKL